MANKYTDEDVLQLSYEIIQLIEQNISVLMMKRQRMLLQVMIV